MSKSLIDMLLDDIADAFWTPERVGKYGETLTARKLKTGKLFGRNGEILRNIYVPKDNGETSEIDVMFITQKGIFVFESKNYSGWIFGDERSQYWTDSLPNRIKNKFYNPIKQNRTHIRWLANYLGEGIPLFSIIVFSERCELKKVNVVSPDIHVIKRDRMNAVIKEIWKLSPDVLSEDQIDEIYNKLKPLTNVTEAEKQEHVDQINEKYHKGKYEKKKSYKDRKNPSDQKEDAVINNDVADESIAKAAEEDNTDAASINDFAYKNDAADEKAESENITADEKADIVENNDIDEKAAVDEKAVADKKSSDENAAADELICPRCGAKLILRTAQKGENKGRQFYGCSNFPKCRYIKNI